MRALIGFGILLLCTGGLFAQRFGGSATPYTSGGFPSVVFPAGTPSNYPGLTRFPYNPVYPAGGGPQFRVPYSSNFNRSYRGTGGYIYSYPYPVYVGGYDASAGGNGAQAAVPPPDQQQAGGPPPAAPIIINIGVPGAAGGAPPAVGPPGAPPYSQEATPQEEAAADTPHYLIALRDHTIYSAVAYWVDGSTLHYFTSGNIHNQVSVSLVDRELTERLNKESGLTVNLPK
jgi:hypothetical protein